MGVGDVDGLADMDGGRGGRFRWRWEYGWRDGGYGISFL